MIKIINSNDVSDKSIVMICAHCGRDFTYERTSQEGTNADYVFETDGIDFWCMCNNCRKKLA